MTTNENENKALGAELNAELTALSAKYGIGLYEIMTGEYDPAEYAKMEAEKAEIIERYQKRSAASILGSIKSERKSAASRKNGKLGGRGHKGQSNG
jgi:hypothetical protein